MRFVILSAKPLPIGNGVHGPILSPAEYDVHLVLKLLALRIDVREVMEDGSYRKLDSNDEKLLELLKAKSNKNRENIKEHRNAERVVNKLPQGNVKLKGEVIKTSPAPKKEKQKPKEEVKKQKPKEEVKQEEPKKEFIIDELEKPE